MKILIDGHMLGMGEGGNERYISNLSRELQYLANIDLLVTKKQRALGKIKQLVVSKSNLVRYFWQIPVLFKQGDYDFVLTTYFVSPLIAKRNVVIVHDMLPYRHPEFFSIRERLQFLFLGWSMKASMGILVPSEFVKDEIVSFYPELKSKIFITSEASDPSFYNMTMLEKKKVQSKYEKDIPSVLVFGSKFDKRPVKPILDGLRLFGKRIKIYVLQSPDKLSKDDYPELNLVLLGKLSDKQLNEYYNLVDAVIYPTVYEGFGLPVIEAMKLRVPVITTNILPINDLAKKAAYYIDLDDKNSIKAAIECILSDKVERSFKLNYGYNRANQYSWNKTAKKTVLALTSFMEKL